MHLQLELLIKRFLGDKPTLPTGWEPFLAAVDDVYASSDAGRAMIEHSRELNERFTEMARTG